MEEGLLLTIFLSLICITPASSEKKDNSHLQNKFDTHRSCNEQVAVLFSQTDYKRDYQYLFPLNKIVSCNPEINLPNEWAKTITPIKKFGKVNRDQSRVRAYPFAGSISGYQVGNLNTGEVIFIDSLVYNSWEKEDEWYRNWYSFKIKDDFFYIWKGSIDLIDK